MMLIYYDDEWKYHTMKYYMNTLKGLWRYIQLEQGWKEINLSTMIIMKSYVLFIFVYVLNLVDILRWFKSCIPIASSRLCWTNTSADVPAMLGVTVEKSMC
ncbi:hypothetical protein ARALYDRAFT_487854 [Arabidopsis lyrata subsp. lyrata]|uniref:Uncharacterized protein n=1 Tax=Arabidopsis lyrata subsp. lyrata TaxID=81972 RepID=D7M2V4_ARALL|nr:hypothetical protein ARALYDRAFT_487854 [Arabidopsis lyrata subsp. lyrata]